MNRLREVSSILNFNISTPATIRHLKDISFYDNNYYEIGDYGDWFYGKCNILRQKYDECDNCYTYSLGYLENNKFVAMIYWVIGEDILKNVKVI